MKNKIDECCGRCGFWDSLNDTIPGDCHRHAPVDFDADQYGNMVSVWSRTRCHNWCGDFERLEDERTKI